jgi:hypothetical protein
LRFSNNYSPKQIQRKKPLDILEVAAFAKHPPSRTICTLGDLIIIVIAVRAPATFVIIKIGGPSLRSECGDSAAAHLVEVLFLEVQATHLLAHSVLGDILNLGRFDTVTIIERIQ